MSTHPRFAPALVRVDTALGKRLPGVFHRDGRATRLRPETVQWCAQLARQVAAVRLVRPQDPSTAVDEP